MTTGENRFSFVCPMYNASATLGQCLASLVGQSYKNWRVILIDDVSHRDEILKEKEIIETWQRVADPGQPDSHIQVIWNDEKMWEVANVLHGIAYCADDDIVCRIDGDDWLTDLDALAILNAAYQHFDADVMWTNHRWGFGDRNISGPMPMGADPYKHPWVSSHLKTFRKKLINDVNDQNFRGEDGEYVRRAGDQAIFLPVLHRAKRRIHLPRVCYHYTIVDEPATYQTPDARFQRDEALFLRARGFVQ
jgi:glycosyltransferase involved in cell wall biosynthesis